MSTSIHSQLKTIQGPALPLVGNDIDTDRIIPARFLRCVTFDGLGEHVFADDRQQDPNHAFNQPQYQGAKVLVVNRNFGCGSSREHAPQAIARRGIEAIIGESFAEIFFGNCLAMGVPCLMATPETVTALQGQVQADPTLEVKIDLENRRVTCGNFSADLSLADGPHQMLTGGTWDACGQLVAQAEAIAITFGQLPYGRWGHGA